jgi:DNA polymerase III epsilon subunit-like protein
MTENRICVAIDTETTGLNEQVHDLIEIAIVVYDPITFIPAERFVSLVKPLRPWTATKEAMAVNHLDLVYLTNEAPAVHQVRNSLLEWKTDMFGEELIEPMGHNYASFDQRFMRAFLGADTYDKVFSHRCLDTLILARALKQMGKLKAEGNGLTALAKHFGLEPPQHSAYGDAVLAINIYKRLLEIAK